MSVRLMGRKSEEGSLISSSSWDRPIISLRDCSVSERRWASSSRLRTRRWRLGGAVVDADATGPFTVTVDPDADVTFVGAGDDMVLGVIVTLLGVGVIIVDISEPFESESEDADTLV